MLDEFLYDLIKKKRSNFKLKNFIEMNFVEMNREKNEI